MEPSQNQLEGSANHDVPTLVLLREVLKEHCQRNVFASQPFLVPSLLSRTVQAYGAGQEDEQGP
jgi:hypothetical protein